MIPYPLAALFKAGAAPFRIRVVDTIDTSGWLTCIQPSPPEPSDTDGTYCPHCGVHRTELASRMCPCCEATS